MCSIGDVSSRDRATPLACMFRRLYNLGRSRAHRSDMLTGFVVL